MSFSDAMTAMKGMTERTDCFTNGQVLSYDTNAGHPRNGSPFVETMVNSKSADSWNVLSSGNEVVEQALWPKPLTGNGNPEVNPFTLALC